MTAAGDEDLPGTRSPLRQARLRATMTLEEAAAAAGIGADEALWLEESRLYRFASSDAAIAATVAYAGAVGALASSARQGQERARRLQRHGRRRLMAAGALVLLAAGIAAAVLAATRGVPGSAAGDAAGGPALQPAVAAAAGGSAPVPAAAAGAPAREEALAGVVADVLDAAGRPQAAQALARRLRALGVRVGRVAAAGRRDEPDTAVWFEPGGGAAGAELARRLGLPARALPGGDDPRRLVVIVGRRGLGR